MGFEILITPELQKVSNDDEVRVEIVNFAWNQAIDLQDSNVGWTWEVDTDRGPTRFVLRGEENIRRLPGGMLMIADEHGIQYLIRKLRALDKPSRKLLDRFL